MLWGPFVALFAWGALYLLGCLNVLSAPGRAVRLEYQSPGGKVVFTAKTFALDPIHGRLSVSYPRVVGPQGLVFACQRVEAEGLRLGLGDGDSIKVRLLRPQAVLRRERSGKFEFVSLLPPREGEPSKVPYSVEATGGQVQYIDATRPEGWRVQAIVPKLNVDGIGDHWMGSGRLIVSGAGPIDASAQSSGADSTSLTLIANKLESAALLRGFRETVDGRNIASLQEVEATSLTVSGRINVVLQKGERTAFAGQASAAASGVRYRSYAFSDAKFTGAFGTDGARGLLAARAPGLDAVFDGQTVWTEASAFAGRLRLASPNLDATPAWFRNLIPKEVTFRDARFDGIASLDAKGKFQLQGPVVAASAKAHNENLGRTSLQLHIDEDKVTLGQIATVWQGQVVSGALQIGLKDRRVAGAFTAPRIDLRTVARRFEDSSLTGRAEASALVRGSTAKPEIRFDAHGVATYRDLKNAEFSLNASSDGKVVIVQRGLLDGAQGRLAIDGTAPLDGTGLKLDWLASDLEVGKFWRGAEGKAGGAGTITGSLKRPVATGTVESIGLKQGDFELPFVAASFRVDRDALTFTQPRMLKGPTVIGGKATWNFKTGALAGDFSVSDIQPSLWIDLGITGLVDIKNGKVAGTIERPALSAEFHADGLFIGDRLAKNLDGALTFSSGKASIDRFTANLFDGTISGSGQYDVDTGAGAFTVDLKDAQVAKIADLSPESGDLTGTMNAHLKGAYAKSTKLRIDGNGQADNLRLNGIALGSGDLSFNGNGDDVAGSVRIGNLDRYQLVDNIRYNRSDGTIAGDLLIANTPLADVYRATERLFPNLPEGAVSALRSIAGSLNADGAIGGKLSDPNFDLKVLEATDLTVQGRAAGSLKLQGRKRGTRYDGVELALDGPMGRLSVKGRADTEGDLVVDGDLSGFELSALGLFSPSLNSLQGRADLSFAGSGPARSPVFRASLETSKDALIGFTAEDGTITSVPDFKVLIDTISLDDAVRLPGGGFGGGLNAEGLLTYRGVQATLKANLPFNYPFRVPDGAELDASITLPERDIDSLKALLSGIDVAKTQGIVSGAVRLHGPLDRVALDGKVLLKAPKLGLEGAQTQFTDVDALLSLSGNVLSADVQASGKAGGTAKLHATTPLSEAGGFALLDAGTLDSIFDRKIAGRLDVEGFRLSERLPGKAAIDGLLTGRIDISGPIRSALLSGKFAISKGQFVLPSEETVAGEAPVFAIDPRFQIDLAIADSLNIRSSTTNIDLTGSGGASGTLNRPDVYANLNVEKGTFKLPTAKVTLDPDGTVRARYQPGAADGQDARIDVDLQGRTRVVARSFTDRVQRYDVRLDIRGDLLKDGGLNLNATSNPPDLTQDQILALLGQADALSGLSGIGSDRQAQQKVRDALAGFAVPALLDPFTSKLGAALGLDSLTLEFNLGNQASISFGKALGRDFTLTGRRQITNAAAGQRPEFSFELTYRPPNLRRFSLSFGVDQDRPYKISFEYGFRF